VRKKFFKLVMAISIALLSGTLATAGQLKQLNPVASCASLATLSADTVPDAMVHISSATEQAGAHPYCSVKGFLEPAINFEVRLPTTGWTQRYLQTGCGGLCGMLSIRSDHDEGCTPLTDGSVVLASSDMGHGGAMGDGSWGSDPQKRIDFAHRGMHVTTLVAKALIKAYYGQPQRYAYFSGCSDGGREALIEAQRYPQDFDGIAAGAPALNFTVQNSFYHAWMAKSNMDAAGRAIINPIDLPVLHRVVLAQCDALDGLKDGQITDPRQCHVKPSAALCKGAYEPGKCLTAAQVDAARKLYAGAMDANGKHLVVGSVQPGSELSWAGVFVPFTNGGSIPGENMALGTINNLLFSPNPATPYTVHTWPFTAEMLAQEDTARQLYSADSPDLTGFAEHGGKLLLWHGWSDPHISPKNTLDYYHRVALKMGKAERAKFARLFLFPGMYHCGGGDGPSEFPLLAALMSWVEDGHAPQVLIAHRMPERPMGPPPGVKPPPLPDGAKPMGPPPAGMMPPMAMTAKRPQFTPRSRPVYAYPQVAQYKGKGSVDDAANFEAIMPPANAEIYDWLGAK